jgi:hypothetical protein
MTKQLKIIHITAAHPRYDAGIFLKIFSSLDKTYTNSVSLVVAYRKGDEFYNGAINN